LLCPLLVVISKMDLVEEDPPLDELMKVHSVESVSSSYFASRLAADGDGALPSLLERFGEELRGTFETVNFAFSSIRLVLDTNRLGRPVTSSLAHWISVSALRSHRVSIRHLLLSILNGRGSRYGS
jgi:hypothetical protein